MFIRTFLNFPANKRKNSIRMLLLLSLLLFSSSSLSLLYYQYACQYYYHTKCLMSIKLSTSSSGYCFHHCRYDYSSYHHSYYYFLIISQYFCWHAAAMASWNWVCTWSESSFTPSAPSMHQSPPEPSVCHLPGVLGMPLSKTGLNLKREVERKNLLNNSIH